jgi:thiol-disulfide isomerase/thioredoxin
MEKSIIVISAVWCPSCLILNKHLKKIKENYNIEITKLDYDFDDIEEYNVGDKLPVIILKDKNNNEIKRLIGEKSYQEIVDFLEV